MTSETTILFLEREFIKLEEALEDFTNQTTIRIKAINETITTLRTQVVKK